MTKTELYKLVEHELNWLVYYANKESREKLTKSSNIYDVLISIGYTKRVVPLDKRCSCGVLTCNTNINLNTPIEHIYQTSEVRNISNNCYSPLEVYWILYPEEKTSLINILNKW